MYALLIVPLQSIEYPNMAVTLAPNQNCRAVDKGPGGSFNYQLQLGGISEANARRNANSKDLFQLSSLPVRTHFAHLLEGRIVRTLGKFQQCICKSFSGMVVMEE